MTTNQKETLDKNLKRASLISGILVALALLFSAFVILPERVDQIEGRVSGLEERERLTLETLYRIDERLENIQRRLE